MKYESMESGTAKGSLASNGLSLNTCGLYYKPMMVVKDNSGVINKLEASLTDNTRVIIYDCHMFIVQATGITTITKMSVL
jgi:hypothetical protein